VRWSGPSPGPPDHSIPPRRAGRRKESSVVRDRHPQPGSGVELLARGRHGRDLRRGESALRRSRSGCLLVSRRIEPLAARREVQRIGERLSAARHQSTARGHIGGDRRESVERQACQGRNGHEDVRIAECGRQIGRGDGLDGIARVGEQPAELRYRKAPLSVLPRPAAIHQDCLRLRK